MQKNNLNAIARGLSARSELGSERYRKQRATALSVSKRWGQPRVKLAPYLARTPVILARHSPAEKLDLSMYKHMLYLKA